MPIINPGTGGGSPGPQGPQGIQGFPGFGFDGESGEDGFPIPGSQGPQGTNGTIGRDGSQGIPGEDGLNGEDSFIPGIQGIQGIQGFRGADGEDGLVNDDFWPGFNPFRDDPLEQISRIQDQNLRILPSYSAVVIGPYTINSGKTLTLESGGRFQIFQGAPNAKASVFALQTGTFTISTLQTELMAGLGAANSTQVITPKVSGVIFAIMTGTFSASVGTGPLIIKTYYGTGTPPAAGASAPPLSSTQIGNSTGLSVSVVANLSTYSFTLNVLTPALNVGVAYWFDVGVFINSSLALTTALTATNFIAFEL